MPSVWLLVGMVFAAASTASAASSASSSAADLLPSPAALSQKVEVRASAFVPYYTYHGDLKVSGFVKVVGAGILSTASQTLSWRLSNVDPTCVTPPAAGADPNACGIHIHEGMSCAENAGDHFYNKALVSTDPWHAVKYLAVEGSSGVWSASGDNAKVITGLSDTAVLGHTMVVHNSVGGRIACSIVA
mmetsp:Transcript_639/g.2681  ORF Transcript_639/g.2681 Transcript_639/m.2681 type:complete len:188 (+) Transcript_639:67-630(+)